MMQLGGLKGNGTGGIKAQPDEVRQVIESVRDTTANPEVRRVMERALEVYNKQLARPGADSDCYRNLVSDTQDVCRRTLSKEGLV